MKNVKNNESKKTGEDVFNELSKSIGLLNYFDNDSPTPTNIIPLDVLLNGGLTNGITQLVGESGCGKTSVSLQIASSYCKKGKKVLYIDTKGDITRERLGKFGLDEYINKEFIYLRESAFKVVEDALNKFIGTDEFTLIVIDSIAELINDVYLKLDKKGVNSDNYNTAYNSKPLSLLSQKLGTLAVEKNLTFLFTNQFRNKMKMYGAGAGTIKKIYGPKVLHNKAKNTVVISQIDDKIKYCKDFKAMFDGLENCHIGTTLQFTMHKGCNTLKSLPFFLVYGEGCLPIHSALFKMLNDGNVIQNGSWFTLKGQNIKANGIKDFTREVSIFFGEVDLVNSKPLNNFYKSLVDDD